MRRALATLAWAVLVAAPPAEAQRELLSLDRGWSFVEQGDGGEGSVESRWRRVDLPFAGVDAAGRFVLRRELRAPLAQRGHSARVRLMGAHGVAAAHLDGVELPLERRGFDVVADLGDALADGARHELLVTVETEGRAAEPGRPEALGGVARGARLEFLGELHLDPRDDSEVPPVAWVGALAPGPTLALSIPVVSRADEERSVTLRAAVADAAGASLAAATVDVAIAPRGAAEVRLQLDVDAAAAWSSAAPSLVGVTVELLEGDVVLDRLQVTTGLRPLFERGHVAADALVAYRALAPESALGRGTYDRLSSRARRRDVVRLAELGVAVALPPSGLPAEAFLEECDLRGVEVVVPQREAWSAPRRRAVSAAAERHPSVALVDGGAKAGAPAMPASSRAAAGAVRRAHAAAFARAARRASCIGDAPVAIGSDGAGAFTGDRLPTLAYHRLRASADRPTAYPAIDWVEAAAGGDLVVYASGDAVEVFVDDVSLGRRRPWRGVAKFVGAPAAEREVLVRAWRGGRIDAERRLAEAGPPAQILLVADELGLPLSAVENDRVWVHALVLDERGTVCSGFDGEVAVSLLGAGAIVGDHRPRAQAGAASVVLRATGPDPITLAATADGGDALLASNRLTLLPDGF